MSALQEKKEPQNLSFPEAESLVLNFWQEAHIFDKSLAKESPKGDYIFYDGLLTGQILFSSI